MADSETSRSEYRPLLHQDTGNGYGRNPTYMTYREPRAYKHWPWFVWFLLRFIGLFNSRHIVATRRCHICRLTADLEEGCSESDVCRNLAVNSDPDFRSGCAVCRSEWSNGSERYRPYSETDIGVAKWNHRGSTILSIVWHFILIILITYDFLWYMINYWGKEDQIIRLISYSVFLLSIIVTPVLSLTANVCNIVMNYTNPRLSQDLGFTWYHALSIRYIVRRLQHLQLGESGLPYKAFLGLCLVWPSVNGIFRIVLYFAIVKRNFQDEVHVLISLHVCMLGMVVFGAFCYIMLLLRLSFQNQIRHKLAFLRCHVGAVDVCRRSVVSYAAELGSIFRLVSVWILFMLAVSTWAITTQVCWDYAPKGKASTPSQRDVKIMIILKTLIWSEHTMFILLPIVAVGGIDLNRIWVQYTRSISKLRSEEYGDFWDKIIKFCKEQSPVTRVKAVTLMFSALGLFLGLKLTDQNIAFWSHTHKPVVLFPSIPYNTSSVG
ncbi:uncharacterized protein LOC117292216 [Asterias rubens]|uniref:uncharacterized protein LOC117292216 n=1 Tax=Asterias rubens TaxID=7604 RepID=UPI001455D7C4|nr:uncharacterized protein LOC117292216 [Asterias rubens]